MARYRQIQEQLQAQILAGVYRPGDRLPTEVELAAMHGVSRVTSAAALNALAREGVVQRAPRRGTVVTPAAERGTAPGRPLIAWIQPLIDPAFGLDLLLGIERAAHQAGYNLMLRLTGASRADEERAIRHALAAGAVGLALFLQDGETYNGEVLRLVLNKFPLVLVDRYLRGVECASVQSDNVAGARLVVEELVRAGHRHTCALVLPPRHTSTIEDRLEGYTQELAGANIPLDRSLLYVEERLRDKSSAVQPAEEIVDRFAAYLQRKPEISAVFATNAPLALLTLRAAERLRRRIPADLSVVGIDALEAYPLALPAFTCALQQSVEIGKLAVQLLQEQMAGAPPRRVMLPMRLAQAGSVAAPRDLATAVLEHGDLTKVKPR